MTNINTGINLGKLNFTFTDEDGDVFSSFRMNPADINIVNRCAEVSDYFSKRQDKEIVSVEDVLKLNAELESKIAYILGYDATKDIFGVVPATTVLPDGSMFALTVFETIANCRAERYYFFNTNCN